MTTVWVSEDDERMGLESPSSSSPVANAAVCTTCKRTHGAVARTARGLETIALEDGYKTCARCRERARKRTKKTPLVNTASCSNCGKEHGDVVNTRKRGPLKTVLESCYERCERCRLGVDRAYARAVCAGDVESSPGS